MQPSRRQFLLSAVCAQFAPLLPFVRPALATDSVQEIAFPVLSPETEAWMVKQIRIMNAIPKSEFIMTGHNAFNVIGDICYNIQANAHSEGSATCRVEQKID